MILINAAIPAKIGTTYNNYLTSTQKFQPSRHPYKNQQ
jgi:hypothetical protein